MTNKGRTKSGVIAVLFLVIVGFIFAAISLSMHTGQVVERRIATDQATDSAAFAFASKSAQGLNFIAANNLATAASVHMAGVIHIAADWGILFDTLFRAKSMWEGKSPVMTEDDEKAYDKIYSWFRPAAKTYLTVAIGLSKLSGAIKAIFPYLGMAEAIHTGAANVPGALFLPFGVAPNLGTPASTAPASGTFFQKAIKALKNVATSALPEYKGLTRINSDEAFCLAFRASEHMGNDRHKISGWITPQAFANTPLSGIGDVFSKIVDAFSVIGIIGNFVGLKVGFSGCGFGPEGDTVGGSSSFDAMLVAQILANVLKGPVSGRSMKFQVDLEAAVVLPPKAAQQLAKELDDKYTDICHPANYPQWSVAGHAPNDIATAPDPRTGLCIVPKDMFKKYISGAGFQQGQSTGGRSTPNRGEAFLFDYETACFGTILFKWEGFAGLELDHVDAANNPIPKPASSGPPGVGPSDAASDLCPPFTAEKPADGQEGRKYPLRPTKLSMDDLLQVQQIANFKSYVNLSRSAPLLKPILDDLVPPNGDTNRPPPKWPGNFGRPHVFASITRLEMCAADPENNCPFHAADGSGYFMNKNGDKFFPKLNQLNWLCPAAAKGDPTALAIRAAWKFDHPEQDKRWILAREQVGLGPTQYLSIYPAIELWHNQRVDTIVAAMNCEEYERYDSAPPASPMPIVSSSGNSNNYCVPGAHMCWQKALQDHIGKNIMKEADISFYVPAPPPQNQANRGSLEESLHYAVVAFSPLRSDNGRDIIGGDPTLPHCPEGMTVDAVLATDPPAQVRVCDIQPVLQFIGRAAASNSSEIPGTSQTPFGGGDTNLASGGAMEMAAQNRFGTSGFMALSAAAVRYENTLAEDPYRPDPSQPPTSTSQLKSHQMFWPSWKPVLEPSRVFSRVLPKSISPLFED